MIRVILDEAQNTTARADKCSDTAGFNSKAVITMTQIDLPQGKNHLDLIEALEVWKDRGNRRGTVWGERRCEAWRLVTDHSGL
jgi:hypothetical protein